MTDEKTAEIFAGYTAIIAVLVENLSEAGKLDQHRFVENLYDLLEAAHTQRPGSSYSAPIKHLISVIEKGQS